MELSNPPLKWNFKKTVGRSDLQMPTRCPLKAECLLGASWCLLDASSCLQMPPDAYMVYIDIYIYSIIFYSRIFSLISLCILTFYQDIPRPLACGGHGEGLPKGRFRGEADELGGRSGVCGGQSHPAMPWVLVGGGVEVGWVGLQGCRGVGWGYHFFLLLYPRRLLYICMHYILCILL